MHVEMKLIVILRRSVQWFILNIYMSTSFKYISYQPGNLTRFQCMVLFLSVIYSKCYNTAEDFFYFSSNRDCNQNNCPRQYNFTHKCTTSVVIATHFKISLNLALNSNTKNFETQHQVKLPMGLNGHLPSKRPTLNKNLSTKHI